MQHPRVNPYEAPQSSLLPESEMQAPPSSVLRHPQNVRYTYALKSLKAEAKTTICWALVIHAMLAVVLLAAYWNWPFNQVAFVVLLSLLCVQLAGVVAFFSRHFYFARPFLCELNETHLRCECPDLWVSQSFCLELQDLTHVSYRNDADGIFCSVLTRWDQEIQLPGEYGNPLEQFGEELVLRLGHNGFPNQHPADERTLDAATP